MADSSEISYENLRYASLNLNTIKPFCYQIIKIQIKKNNNNPKKSHLWGKYNYYGHMILVILIFFPLEQTQPAAFKKEGPFYIFPPDQEFSHSPGSDGFLIQV